MEVSHCNCVDLFLHLFCPPCSGYLLALSHNLPINRGGDEGDEGNEGAKSEEMSKLPEVWAECDEHPR